MNEVREDALGFEGQRIEAMWSLVKVIGLLEELVEEEDPATVLNASVMLLQLRRVAKYLDRLPKGAVLLPASADDEEDGE